MTQSHCVDCHDTLALAGELQFRARYGLGDRKFYAMARFVLLSFIDDMS
jgi:hypothetical protein